MEIHTIDLEFQGLPEAIASYLVIGPGGAVLVETGPATTRARLVAGLERHRIRPQDIEAVLVTHVHLDHAGDAGWWARRGVPVHVHRKGAPHLVDPTKLLASAARIYGDRMDELWGEVAPAPRDRVVPLDDGERVEAGGLVFEAMDSPGHAAHHHVFCVEGAAFTGDAGGIRLPGADLVDLPAPPPEFDLEAWEGTIERLLAADLERLFPTHFGAVGGGGGGGDVSEHLRGLRGVLHEGTAWVRERMRSGMERDGLVRGYLAWRAARAARAGLSPGARERLDLANPPAMSVDGILRYWRKRDGTRAGRS